MAEDERSAGRLQAHRAADQEAGARSRIYIYIYIYIYIRTHIHMCIYVLMCNYVISQTNSR